MAFSNLRYDIRQLAMKRFMTVMWLKEMSEDVILRIKWRRARGPCAGQPSNVMCGKTSHNQAGIVLVGSKSKREKFKTFR